MKNILIIILSVVAVCLWFNYRQAATDVIIKTDTIKKTDTIIVERLKPQRIEVLKIIRDTLYKTDSSKIEVQLPLTKQVYQDSTFRTVISGYKPHLDSLIIFKPNTTITNTKLLKSNKKGFKFSPSIGVGYGMFNKNIDVYVGFSVSYNF